jgi:hypothetical protein
MSLFAFIGESDTCSSNRAPGARYAAVQTVSNIVTDVQGVSIQSQKVAIATEYPVPKPCSLGVILLQSLRIALQAA